MEDGVAVLTLADPGKRNALSRQLSDDLAAAVESALSQEARAIVLDAEPPVFCAGGSLDDLLARSRPLGETYAGFLALAQAPVPTIAAVAGPVIGAGVNLPLACDVVIAGESARFDPRFLDVGIHPGGGHLWRLAQRVGPQGAAALVLCGDVLTGPEAVVAGLAWRCVPDDSALSVALRLARRAAGRSPSLSRGPSRYCARRPATRKRPRRRWPLSWRPSSGPLSSPTSRRRSARCARGSARGSTTG